MRTCETGTLSRDGRAPYGARGLKCVIIDCLERAGYVAPRMGRVD